MATQKTAVKKTKTQRLVEAFTKGEKLTVAQMKSRFGIANPTATISSLRLNQGYAIFAAQSTDSNGRVTTKYHLGTPSRDVVAAGYRVLSGTGMF